MIRAVILLAMISVPASAWGQTQPAPEMSERQRIVQSLATACRDFSDDKWVEADACRRAWFAEHEEAIWRLDLNPHRSNLSPPS
jgi:hypothetical protein